MNEPQPWTREQMDAYLVSKSDDNLIAMTRQAVDDLNKAAANERESDWHVACFAGVMVLSGEMQRRGLRLQDN